MARPPTLGRYSLGVGDRFACEAEAQLRAFARAAALGVAVTPVWNKSAREHRVVGSRPASVRRAADAAARALEWTAPYYVDADHVGHDTVAAFLDSSDCFTIDVAAAVGRRPPPGAVAALLARHGELVGDGGDTAVGESLVLTPGAATAAAETYLPAVAEAGRIYRLIVEAKGEGSFVTEVSMDETDHPQTPAELLLILAALSDEGVPLQTVAPRFCGRFNKGVDYVGDVARFEREFAAHIAAVAHAVRAYGLPGDLKLSVHSGSDKFSIFPAIRRCLVRSGAGVHVKTSGTTWLEELIGLAEAGGDGLALAKDVYAGAFLRRDELCRPYAAVISIEPGRLPSPGEVNDWTAARFASVLRHDPGDPLYDPHVRQLLHVGYAVAAEMGDRYLRALEAARETISANVEENVFERHIRPLFLEG